MDPTALNCTPYPPGDRAGDPFAFADEWRTEAVLGMAFGIQAEEAFDRMPILADALEEAGCDDLMLLNHCRYCESHTPDCWALECVVPHGQEFWTEPIWVAKGQPLPMPAELEAEAVADSRREKVDRVAVTVVRGVVISVVLGVVFVIWMACGALVFGRPQVPSTAVQRG